MTSGSPISVRQRPGSGRSARSAHSHLAVRMNLFVLVRVLFQYLERVDKTVLDMAKEVLIDCERKHNTKDSKYQTLADAISERLRDCVGEVHWENARRIQKQITINRQKKKLQAMKQAVKRRGSSQQQEQFSRSVSQERLGGPQQGLKSSKDEAMEAAAETTSTNSNNLCTASARVDQESECNSGNTSNKEAASGPPQAETGPQAASKGQLPLRKRIMFAQPPTDTDPKGG